MPLTFDETYEPRRWQCDECRRVLGVVMRDTNRVRRLWVFRVQMIEADVPKNFTLWHMPRGLYSVHGADCIPRPGGIECQHCGALKDWTQSKESFERLMSHYQEAKSESI